MKKIAEDLQIGKQLVTLLFRLHVKIEEVKISQLSKPALIWVKFSIRLNCKETDDYRLCNPIQT